MFTRSVLAHTKSFTCVVFHCLVRARIAFIQSQAFGLDQTMTCKCLGFLAMRKCACGDHIKRMCLFSYFP